MNKYPPFVNAYGKLKDVFDGIKEASVPPKFTNDFLYSVLGLKSTSYRAMIPLLKRIGFLDQGNVPTQTYKDYRDDTASGAVLAEKVKEAYSDLYNANEYAHKSGKEDLVTKLRTVLGVGKDDSTVSTVVATFLELVKLSDFDSKKKPQVKEGESKINTPTSSSRVGTESLKFGISYTINLNLPSTTDVEVFNAIFKSLKQNILDNE